MTRHEHDLPEGDKPCPCRGKPRERIGEEVNASECEMKRTVLNRKNSLFVGNERAGRAAAILSSLASTRRRHDVDPQRYLTHLLVGLPGTPMSQLDRWLPDQWERLDPPRPTA